MANVKFYRGTDAKCQAQIANDPDGIYFATDTNKIYMGGCVYCGGDESPFKFNDNETILSLKAKIEEDEDGSEAHSLRFLDMEDTSRLLFGNQSLADILKTITDRLGALEASDFG